MGFYGTNDPTNSVKALKEEGAITQRFSLDLRQSLYHLYCPPGHQITIKSTGNTSTRHKPGKTERKR